MLSQLDIRFGTSARNRVAEANDPGPFGALAALESFYYALNQRDLAVLVEVWSDHPLAQLNNPIGGILRGGDEIGRLYERILSGPVRVEVEFADATQYLGEGHAVFAGRETGHYSLDGRPTSLSIRTTRYLRYDQELGAWRQFHHHGSIDDAAELAAYQRAVLGRVTTEVSDQRS